MATSRNISGLNKLPDCFRAAPDIPCKEKEMPKKERKVGKREAETNSGLNKLPDCFELCRIPFRNEKKEYQAIEPKNKHLYN
ncbi:MAG: hypothetical protein LBT50_00635 [Prevotellaceae bacterium]|nr:hypothetical protein [Prevotellaceae bacterium]